MKPCAFCNADLSGIYNEIVKQGINFNEKGVILCCEECGEPLFAEDYGFRKPTDEEYYIVVNTPEVAWSRLIHIEQKKYEYPFAKTFGELRSKFKTIEEKTGKPMPNIGQDLMKAVFIYGAMVALQEVKKAHNESEDGDIEAAKFFILNAEANRMKTEIIDAYKAFIPD